MTVTTIILESDDPAPVLIDGVTVRLFDTLGAFVTSGVSDGAGEVVVDVPDADYDLYFFKSGVSVLDGMPQRITVDAADTDVPPNTFKVLAHVHTLPEAADPALCRISGDLRGADGLASRDGRLVFVPCIQAGYVAGDLLSPKNFFPTSPDEDGHYEFELIRGMEYRAYFTHVNDITGITKEPFEMAVIVPDLPAIHIKDLLFPLPIGSTFAPNTLALTAGDDPDESVVLAVTYSDGSDRVDNPPQGTQFTLSNDNEAVATAERVGSKIIVTPLAAGVANITVERILSTENLIFDPTPAFTTDTLEVTVT